MTGRLIDDHELGDGPFPLQRWHCLLSDCVGVCEGGEGGCVVQPRLHQNLVLHQMKGRHLQSSAHSVSNNRMEDLGPSSCKTLRKSVF